MLKQPSEKRNLSKEFLEAEKKRIEMLNGALGNIELTPAEEQSLIWLCGWETSTLQNVISAFKKSYMKKSEKGHMFGGSLQT